MAHRTGLRTWDTLQKKKEEPWIVTFKRVKYNTVKAIGHAIKEWAIESGTNLVIDAIMGN